ncbi:MAG: hypothetical protein ACI3ZR_05470 [bacterium]
MPASEEPVSSVYGPALPVYKAFAAQALAAGGDLPEAQAALAFYDVQKQKQAAQTSQ